MEYPFATDHALLMKSMSPAWTRRKFLEANVGTAVAVAVPRVWRGHAYERAEVAGTSSIGPTRLRDPRIKAFVLRTLDAARTGGAHYADVRLTSTTVRQFNGGAPGESISLGLSARALVDGYWGWAARPDVTEDAGPWVGQEAVRLAKANAATGVPRTVELGTIPVVPDGTWATPLEIDPFSVPVAEVIDWFTGVAARGCNIGVARGYPDTRMGYGNRVGVEFEQQERVFASTDGSYLTQTVYVTRPVLEIGWYRGVQNIPIPINGGRGAGQAGWEYLTRAPIDDLIRQTMDRVDAALATRRPVKPFEVGQYDLILPARVMGQLLNQTLGYATELDRALGYEANAGGTSYLGPDPLAQLGTTVASPLVTVTADRSAPKALATVQWDEEGVVPEDFTLVKDGVLLDYQTTREQAAWLAPWYAKHGKPVRSHGCAAAPDALDLAMQHQPNLVLQPAKTDDTLEDLVAGLDHGVLVDGLYLSMDFQHVSGLGLITGATEVRRGKRVATLEGRMAILFNARDLWKHVHALGGRKSQQWMDSGQSLKGEPQQATEYSLAAVPAVVVQQAVVDPLRTV